MVAVPIKHGLSQAQVLAGLNAATGTMTALYWQRMTGSGQHVDVSIMESVIAMQVPHPVSYSYTGGHHEKTNRYMGIDPSHCAL